MGGGGQCGSPSVGLEKYSAVKLASCMEGVYRIVSSYSMEDGYCIDVAAGKMTQRGTVTLHEQNMTNMY